MPERKWTAAEDAELLHRHAGGESSADIGLALGRTEGSVRARRCRLKLVRVKRTESRRVSRVREILSAQPLWSNAEIARLVGVQRNLVRKIRRESGVAALTGSQARGRGSVYKSAGSPPKSPSDSAYLDCLARGPLGISQVAKQRGVCYVSARRALLKLRRKGLAFAECQPGRKAVGRFGQRWYSLAYWFAKYQPLINAKACLIHKKKPHVALEEVVAQFHVELGKCVPYFRPGKSKFSTYGINVAVLSTRQWCSLELSKGVRFPSQLRSRSLGLVTVSNVVFLGAGDFIRDDKRIDVTDRDHCDAPPVIEDFWTRAVACLPPRERLIILGHFRDGRTFDDLGTEVGVSRGRVEQLIRKCVALISRSRVFAELDAA